MTEQGNFLVLCSDESAIQHTTLNVLPTFDQFIL